MALTQEFNELSGKIISGAELRKILTKAGYSEAQLSDPNFMSPEQHQALISKTIALPEQERAELQQLIADMGNSTYLDAASFKALTDPVLQSKDEQTATANALLVEQRMSDYKDNLYIDAQPIAKFITWALAGEKLADDFVKAAAQCTDHSNDAAGLVNITKGMDSIITALTAKFGSSRL